MPRTNQKRKFHLISSVLTSSKDVNFPTLGFLSFITSCFTSVYCNAVNKLLIKKMNLNTPTALTVADIFMFVIKEFALAASTALVSCQ